MAQLCSKTLILCGGLQSGGTTLVSYCFLQRADTDGVLDADNDLLPALDARWHGHSPGTRLRSAAFVLARLPGSTAMLVGTCGHCSFCATFGRCGRRSAQSHTAATGSPPRTRRCDSRVRRFVEDWRAARRTARCCCDTKIS